jgi:hypothetical protein
VDYWSALTARTAQSYFAGLGLTSTILGGLPAGTNARTREAVILVHPMWDTDDANLRAEPAAALAAGLSLGLQPRLQSIFRAVRFPYE